jgi:hypothetical protein
MSRCPNDPQPSCGNSSTDSLGDQSSGLPTRPGPPPQLSPPTTDIRHQLRPVRCALRSVPLCATNRRPHACVVRAGVSVAVAEVIFMRPAAVHDSPGDPAFEQVYPSSYSTLVGQLFLLTTSRAEAEDVVQEAFARLWPADRTGHQRQSRLGGHIQWLGPRNRSAHKLHPSRAAPWESHRQSLRLTHGHLGHRQPSSPATCDLSRAGHSAPQPSNRITSKGHRHTDD